MKTPVAFFIFNRPNPTKLVFEAIRQAKPPILLVIADGLRPDQPDDKFKCAAARAVIESVDWDCQVLTNYSDVNMGCKKRVSSGLDWVFETVDQAIILEDDCLPHLTFFDFCEELLERYKDDERVMSISGNNFQFGRQRTEYSYYFSIYNHIWGWASWRRAWQKYDVQMKLWPIIGEDNWLQDILQDKQAVKYWKKVFQCVYENRLNTWDYQWMFSCWISSGLTILPNFNLVSNIGFDSSGTHTKSQTRFANMPIEKLKFPLKHPPFLIRNYQADTHTFTTMFKPNILMKLYYKFCLYLNINFRANSQASS